MLGSLDKALSNLKGRTAVVRASDAYPEKDDSASIFMEFSGGTRLRAEYWRVIKNGKHYRSNFDHNQIYGLPTAIDAVAELTRELQNQSVIEAHHDKETGDLLFQFTSDVKLQIFNFTGYEVWEIHFPDGSGEYSNYAR
jgi:hypothetical protein